MNFQFYSTLLIFLFSLSRCDRTRVSPQAAPAPQVTEQKATSKVQLFLFAGGNCHPCKVELPMLRDWLDLKFKEDRVRIDVTVYFIQGNPGTVKATQKDADEFGKTLNIPFKMKADPKKEMFKSYYELGSGIPACALNTETGEKIRVYKPGPGMSLDELENDIKAALE